MDRTFHFITGLPRSGSTLLAALLRQNPRFEAGMTSPVGSLFTGMLGQFSAGSEFGPVVDQDTRRRLLRGVFDAFYAPSDKPVIFDTNRMWAAKMPALMDLFPSTRVIACVRNVAWVMDSIERLYRNNPYEQTKLFVDESERNSVYSRIETLAQRNRLVGFAWSALKEAYYGDQAQSLLVVDYMLLAQSPERVLKLIYEFLGESWFDGHHFDRVEYDAPAFDEALGVSGLHRVRNRVDLQSRRTLLPPDLFEQYSKLSFWEEGTGSAAHVIRAKSEKLSS